MNTQALDHRYILMIGGRLEGFSRTANPDVWNFRCPECGDSSSNKSKRRGYFLLNEKGNYRFWCHNCHESLSFEEFLHRRDENLYREYVKEKIQERRGHASPIVAPQRIKKVIHEANRHLKDLTKVSSLRPDHYCKKYVISRQIPTPYHSRIYFAERFKEWSNKVIPESFKEEDLAIDGPRLVIPMFAKNEEMIGFTGRSLSKNPKLRYILLRTNEEAPKIFGLDRADLNRRGYVVEGPIDAMFLDNCLATMGGVLHQAMKQVQVSKDLFRLVYDNEPRNPDVVAQMLDAARAGHPVCVWPESVTKKDINAMILERVPAGEYVRTEAVAKAASRIMQIIDENTWQGPQAMIQIGRWKRC